MRIPRIQKIPFQPTSVTVTNFSDEIGGARRNTPCTNYLQANKQKPKLSCYPKVLEATQHPLLLTMKVIANTDTSEKVDGWKRPRGHRSFFVRLSSTLKFTSASWRRASAFTGVLYTRHYIHGNLRAPPNATPPI